MQSETIMTALSLFTSQIIVPLLFILWLSNPPFDEGNWESRINWIVHAVITGASVSFALTVGAQSWTSIYIGAFLLVFFLVALVRSFRKLPENWRPFTFGQSWQKKIFISTQLLVGLFFVPLSMYAFTGYFTGEKPLSLRFPMENGVYIVGHGGSNPLINYHNTNEKQAYSLDLLKLNVFGTRATGLHPGNLDRYAIYGDTLYSPCGGRVQKAVSDMPEFSPPKRGEGHPAGNRVVIRCRGALVYLAHMMPESVVVDSGSVVAAGAPIGRVGNSGNTTEPHLHIHATRNGNGIPITFNGRFLVRNSLIWR